MSIRWKFAIICIALVFLSMIATGTFIIFSLRQDETENARLELQRWADQVYFRVMQDTLDILPQGVDITTGEGVFELEELFVEPFNAFIAQPLFASGMDAFIINAHDRLTIQGTQPNQYFDSISNSVVITALVGNADFSAFRSYPNPITGEIETWFEYARPIFLDYSSALPNYVIYMRTSADAFLEGLENTTRTIFVGAAIALGAAIILIIAFSIPLTQNLLHLNKKITSFEVGDAPILLEGANDEIGQLANSFNSMSSELNKSMVTITDEKNKMEIIMYNMSDGVLAYDKSGALIHSNYACEELLGINNARNMSMTELFRTVGVYIPINADYNSIEDRTIKRGDKFINASFNSHKNENGVVQGLVVVLQDITKHIRLDNMRKEFVANVSHELRTPLTTIKSYAETLMEGAGDNPEIRDGFLSVINAESDRMTTIIKDLLELSRFDDGHMELNFNTDDLISLAQKNIQNHEINAKNQGKEITFTTELKVAYIKMDANRINQVFNNIISNSLRYSQEGAKINVDIQEREKHYLVYISDDGIGILKEDLRNIFERFYRADKARSRELGGTGLGLSIAKEIMEAHGGRIHAASQFGVGTTMTLRFPKSEG